jgi:hypothetical protein
MRHLRAYKLVATYKMKLKYFLVNIHINTQFTLYKVNGVVLTKLKIYQKMGFNHFHMSFFFFFLKHSIFFPLEVIVFITSLMILNKIALNSTT